MEGGGVSGELAQSPPPPPPRSCSGLQAHADHDSSSTLTSDLHIRPEVAGIPELLPLVFKPNLNWRLRPVPTESEWNSGGTPIRLSAPYCSPPVSPQIMVHCEQGKQRSAAVACAYLIWWANYTRKEAIQYVQSRRRGAVIPGIWRNELDHLAQLAKIVAGARPASCRSHLPSRARSPVGSGFQLASPRGLPPPPPCISVLLPGLRLRQGGGQGCIRREGTSEAAPEAVRLAVGGGCQSGWGRLLLVTNAIEPGTWLQADSGWE